MEGVKMLNTILISFLKIADNFLLTSKTILVQKNKAILAAIVVMLSQFMFYFVISKIISENSLIVNACVAVASGVGSFFAMKIHDKFSKDKLYLNIITSRNTKALRELCEFLKEKNIKYIVSDGYNRDWSKSFVVQVFASTKDKSKMIDKYLETFNCKYLREIVY
jgi:uncharacterized protein YebE (UPF0316 family)